MSRAASMIDWVIATYDVTLTVAEAARIVRIHEDKIVRLMDDR